jgi:hypothetical protein
MPLPKDQFSFVCSVITWKRSSGGQLMLSTIA